MGSSPMARSLAGSRASVQIKGKEDSPTGGGSDNLLDHPAPSTSCFIFAPQRWAQPCIPQISSDIKTDDAAHVPRGNKSVCFLKNGVL